VKYIDYLISKSLLLCVSVHFKLTASNVLASYNANTGRFAYATVTEVSKY